MGLDIHALKLLLSAKRRGVRFDRVLTFGRIELAVLPARAAELLHAEGLPDAELLALGREPAPWFAEPIFRALGATEIVSLDASAYQSASIVHDMNQPIPERYREQFDVVFDGGSIEHVFNFPVAIRNCMEIIRQGGSLFIHTAANNCMGHGFYQFSPELFYRVFAPVNGYRVERMILHGSGPYGSWYEVADPAVIHSRVELISFMPTQMLLHARRSEIVPIFAQAPQQSDYVEEWSGTCSGGPHLSRPIQRAGSRISGKFPPSLRRPESHSYGPPFLSHPVTPEHPLLQAYARLILRSVGSASSVGNMAPLLTRTQRRLAAHAPTPSRGVGC
jgi:SAM-dependent methyltransferase